MPQFALNFSLFPSRGLLAENGKREKRENTVQSLRIECRVFFLCVNSTAKGSAAALEGETQANRAAVYIPPIKKTRIRE